MASLYVGSLKVPSDSLTIGPVHAKVLREKRDELEQALFTKRAEFEGRTSNPSSRASTASGQTLIRVDRKASNQEELDRLKDKYQDTLLRLYEGFQKEWMADPRVSGLQVEPPSGTNGPYLAKSVGLALSDALSEVGIKQPPDPIEYLAHLLRKYAENAKIEQEDAVVDLKTKLAQEELLLTVDKSQQMSREEAQIKQEDDRRKEIFLRSSPRPEEEETSAAASPRTSDTSTDVSAEESATGNHEDSSKLYTISE